MIAVFGRTNRGCQWRTLSIVAPSCRELSIKRLNWRCFSSSWSSAAEKKRQAEAQLPLVALEQARLGYASAGENIPVDLTINQPSQGGHVLLGRNGAGKTLISSVLTGNDTYIHEGKYNTPDTWFPDYSTAQVSFQSHEALLQQGGTAYKAISGGGNNLTKAAQFLVVRFGLYPLLHRDVETLSTGEIRKVLLVQALARRPKLLVLDNAFDGLDVPTRETLADLVSKTLRGFRQDILVQSVDSRATEHTQVLLMTHRAEEIVDEFSTVSYFVENHGVVTEERNDRSGGDMFEKALDMLPSGSDAASLTAVEWSTSDERILPTKDEITSWWEVGRDSDGNTSNSPHMIKAAALHIRRDDATLLEDLNWIVLPGDRWLVAGGNGAGKSTLSRFLACKEAESAFIGDFDIMPSKMDDDGADGGSSSHLQPGDRRPGIGWVSTEQHMATSRSDRLVRDVLTNDGEIATSDDVATFVTRALHIDSLLDRSFSELSQGEQKIVLIASALVARPQLLVLDEPCQGLDLLNRRLVLGLVERICQATDMSLIYITHHLEELIPSVTHVLHLVGGKSVYNGKRDGYDPETI